MLYESDRFHCSLVTKLKKLHWIIEVLVKWDTYIPAPNTSRVPLWVDQKTEGKTENSKLVMMRLPVAFRPDKERCITIFYVGVMKPTHDLL